MENEIGVKLDLIIALLARKIFGVDEILNIVVSGKKKGAPESFIKAYNSLGEKTITELAKDIGISQQALSSVVSTWEKRGVVYKTGTQSHPRYRGLLMLPEKENKTATNEGGENE